MEKKRKISTEPIQPELTTRIKELGNGELDNNVLIELPPNEKVENWLRTSFPIGSTNAVENYFTFINPETESPHTSLMGKSNNGGVGGGGGGGVGVAAIDEDSSVDTTKYIKSNQTRTRRKRSIKQHCFLSSTNAAAVAAAAATAAGGGGGKSAAITSNGKISNQNNIIGRKSSLKQNGRRIDDRSHSPIMQKMKKCSVELLKSPKLSNINCRTGADNNGDAINNGGGDIDDKLSKNIYSVWYIKKKRRTRSKPAIPKINQTIKNGNGRGGGLLRGGIIVRGGSLSSSSCENKNFDTRRLVEQRFSGRLAKKRKNAEKINGGGGTGGAVGAGGIIGDDENDINCKSNQKFLRSTKRKRNLNDEISKNIFRSGL